MRILWFEVTTPSSYVSGGVPLGGWQDSLERIVRTVPDIELVIAFVSEEYSEVKDVDGVKYVPIYTKWTLYERKFKKYWDVFFNKMLPDAKRIVEDFKPDLIHVFSTEWPFGQMSAYTNIPVVIHIMGSVAPLNNASYPPGYSYRDMLLCNWWNPRKILGYYFEERNKKNWEQWERRTWNLVRCYMGRTRWDESLSRMMHPNRRYFHVEEALRTSFVLGDKSWSLQQESKIRLITVGHVSFWKGPDMILKVANILSSQNVDFEWNVAGFMSNHMKRFVEKRIGKSYEECHVHVLGYVNPDDLIKLLCSSTVYVHTSYIENSPNSICEAQCLGVPVISTNVGGISSLVRNGVDGILVPANDPWQMADAIIELSKDKNRLLSYSENNRKLALVRHNDENIKKQLLRCYNSLINEISD